MKRALFTIAMVTICAQSVWAAGIWAGLGATDAWEDTANWDAAPFPNSTATPVTIGDGGYSQTTISVANRSVQSLTFTRDGDFLITGSKQLLISQGVTASSANGHTYTLGVGLTQYSGPTFTYDVQGSNAIVVTQFQYNYNLVKIIKTGDGLLWFNNYATNNPPFGGVEIQAGTVMSTPQYGNPFGYLILNDGAKLLGTSTKGQVDIGGMGVDSIVEGTLGGTLGTETALTISKSGTGKLTFRGNGVYQANGAGGTWNIQWNNGLMELDNTVVNVTDRIDNGPILKFTGGIKLIGTSAAPSSEQFGNVEIQGPTTIEPVAGAGQTATMTFGSWQNAAGVAPYWVEFKGTDFGNTNQVIVNGTWTLNNGISPWGRYGYDFVTKGPGNVVLAFTNYFNGLSGAAAANTVILTAPEAMVGDMAINGLKNTATVLDLNYGTLTIGGSEGAGIIQTGVAGLITNGTLKSTVATGNKSCIYIANDQDLVIDANISAVNVSKTGPGALTIGGAGVPQNVRWSDGALTIDTPNNLAITGNVYGGGHLIKRGTGTLSLSALNNYTTSETEFLAGRTNATGGRPYASGTITIGRGALLYNAAVGFNHSIVLSGTLQMPADYNDGFGAATTFTIPAGETGEYRLDNVNNTAYNARNLNGLFGSGTLIKAGSNISSFATLTGLVCQTSLGSSPFTGNIQIDQGYVKVDAITKWPLGVNTVKPTGTGIFWTSANLNFLNTNFAGNGFITANSQVGMTGTWYTLTSTGGDWMPQGILTLQGNLGFAVNTTASKYARLLIDVLGDGTTVGTDYDQLSLLTTGTTVNGKVTNLLNADLSVSIPDGLTLSGKVYTIFLTNSDLSLPGTGNVNRFHNVAFSPNIDSGAALVNYGLGFISLSNLVYIPQNGTISGLKYRDANGNHAYDSGEPVLAGWSIYLDMNDNGTYDAGDQLAVTGTDGRYSFTELAGSYTVREQLLPGSWTQTAPWPSLAHSITLAAGAMIDTADFGNAIKGDANGDGLVDQQDYTVWYSHYGITTGTWGTGDMNFDNLVDQQDYTLWYSNYGASAGAGVPEPVTMVLLALGGVALLRRRK